jgi:hypothetical protein
VDTLAGASAKCSTLESGSAVADSQPPIQGAQSTTETS